MMSQVSQAARIAASAVSPQPVISILGIDGGTVASVAALLRAGYRVICADSDSDKADTLAQRIALGIGTAVMAALRIGQAEGNLLVTDDIFAAVMESDVTFICQGPGMDFLETENTHALSAIGRTIGAALALKQGFHIVVQQAATLPGVTRSVLIPAIEAASGLEAGSGFGLCHWPGVLDTGRNPQGDRPRPALLGVTDRQSASCLDGIMGRVGTRALIASIELSEMASQAQPRPEGPEMPAASLPVAMDCGADRSGRPEAATPSRRPDASFGLPTGKPLWTHNLTAPS